MPTKIAITVNTSWNVLNFRAGLIRALAQAGYEVVAIAPADAWSTRLRELPCRFVPLEIQSRGTNPLRDLQLMLKYLAILHRERPDVLLSYTAKPNIYGSMAARALNIPTINNIAGLGSTFIRVSWLTSIMKVLYQVALKRSHTVFFQNRDDLEVFLRSRIVRASATRLIPGSGIDLARFGYVPAAEPARFRFLLMGRLLWEKGVAEYVDAARRLKAKYPQAEFCLMGFVDGSNPAGVPQEELDRWVSEGIVSYLGAADDVREALGRADCVVLPSYREGTPRALLEAAAMGRPIVASDVPGCREVVEDGSNGLLCAPRSADDLAAKLERMLGLTHAQRVEMGRRGRAKVEAEFDERLVVQKYLDAIRRIPVHAPPKVLVAR